jgi:L-methionine (R)-S-oxide reductase
MESARSKKKRFKGREDLQCFDHGAARGFCNVGSHRPSQSGKQQRSPGSHDVPRRLPASLPFPGKKGNILPTLMIENRGMTNSAFHQIVSETRRFAETAKDFISLQKLLVELIAERLPYYNWVGFYMLDPTDENVLVLGPFRGAPTDHVRIPVTEGICGAAVAQGETVIVEDVAADPRYLACSIETKSEIVVPIRAHGRIVGEIDIDSHALSAFGADDRSFLEECAELLTEYLEK